MSTAASPVEWRFPVALLLCRLLLRMFFGSVMI